MGSAALTSTWSSIDSASRMPPPARRAMSATASGSTARPSASRMRRSLPSISGTARGRKVKRCSRETTAGRIWLGSVVQKMKRTPSRRLLERLEEDVPALLDALHLVDDEDLAAQVRGARVDARHELAHVVDLVVGGGVQLDDVERPALADGDAAGAGVAGLAVAQVRAVDGLGHDARHGGLARARAVRRRGSHGRPARGARRCGASRRPGPGRPSRANVWARKRR